MDSIKLIGLSLLAAIFCLSCSAGGNGQGRDGTKTLSPRDIVCANTFVISNRNNVTFYSKVNARYQPISSVPLANTVGAVYDCERHTIVAPYAYRDSGASRFGIVFYDIDSENPEDLPLSDGMNSIVDYHKDGVLVATGRMHQRKEENVSDLELTSEVYGHKNSFDAVFAYTHYVDFNEKDILNSFDFLMVEGEIFENRFYGAGIDGLVVYDLEKKRMEKHVKLLTLMEGRESDEGVFNMPKGGQFFSASGSFYYLPDATSYNYTGHSRETELREIDREVLYQLNDDKLLPYIKIPKFDHPSIIRSEDSIGILAHDLSRLAIIDIDNKSLTLKNLDYPNRGERRVDSAVVAGDDLVITLSKPTGETDSLILIYDLRAQRISEQILVEGTNYIVTSTSDASIF